MERQTEGLGSGQKRVPHSSSGHPEDSSDNADETKHVSYALFIYKIKFLYVYWNQMLIF